MGDGLFSQEETGMREALTNFMDKYASAKQDNSKSFKDYVKYVLPRTIAKSMMDTKGDYRKIAFRIKQQGFSDDSYPYRCVGSCGGIPTWADVPWVGIFCRRITESAQKGVYIVYLLSKDTNILYLTLIKSFTEATEESRRLGQSGNRTPAKVVMRAQANQIIAAIGDYVKENSDFQVCSEEGISLGDNISQNAQGYENGTIFYRAYHKGHLPPEQELLDDLCKMMDIYREYERVFYPDNVVAQPEPKSEPEAVQDVPVREAIDKIKAYIAAWGFSYEDGMIENFFLSLKSKPFVILAGTSGTGKTRLVRLFAEAIGATVDNGRYKMVAVRPDWSDSTDLFGHVDLSGHFRPGAIIDFVKDATEHPEKPYILCLDEMNLARVEYYLSDFLSVIETRELYDDGSIMTDPLIPLSVYGGDKMAESKYGELTFPENLYVVGTVNMDETTFPFSKKVLDRANTIEFSYVDLMPSEEFWEMIGDEQAMEPMDLANDFLKSRYLLLSHCDDISDDVSDDCDQLKTINEVLRMANAHIGYRVRDEIVFYLCNNREEELLSEQEAFDYEIMQKILPRIQGSSTSVKKMLCDLFKICAGDFEGYQTEADDLGARMMRAAEKEDCEYPKSARKIAFMVRRYEEDGFTSYWL